jgi:hypothetical protein
VDALPGFFFFFLVAERDANMQTYVCFFADGSSIDELEHVRALFPDLPGSKLLFTPNFASRDEYEAAFKSSRRARKIPASERAATTATPTPATTAGATAAASAAVSSSSVHVASPSAAGEVKWWFPFDSVYERPTSATLVQFQNQTQACNSSSSSSSSGSGEAVDTKVGDQNVICDPPFVTVDNLWVLEEWGDVFKGASIFLRVVRLRRFFFPMFGLTSWQ